MHTIWVSVQPVWKVFLVALVLGAGLPLLFSFGIRGFAGSTDANGNTVAANGGMKAIGAVCFLIVALAVIVGICILANVHPVMRLVGINS
jgi:hypothetical protein